MLCAVLQWFGAVDLCQLAAGSSDVPRPPSRGYGRVSFDPLFFYHTQCTAITDSLVIKRTNSCAPDI